MPLAYSYVPYQKFEDPYDKEKAHRYGTVFPSLNLPYGVVNAVVPSKEFITESHVVVVFARAIENVDEWEF